MFESPVCVCVCVCACVCVRERERENVCVCVFVRKKVYVWLQALIFRSKVLLLDVNTGTVGGKMLSLTSYVVRLFPHTHTHTHTHTIEIHNTIHKDLRAVQKR